MSEKHLTTEDFDYDLPQELIAQTPLKERDQSRLLVLDSKTGKYQDDYFYNVIDRLNPGDALVMNDSRVMPARLYGVKPETGGHVEVLLLNNTDGDNWETCKSRHGNFFWRRQADCNRNGGTGAWRQDDRISL